MNREKLIHELIDLSDYSEKNKSDLWNFPDEILRELYIGASVLRALKEDDISEHSYYCEWDGGRRRAYLMDRCGFSRKKDILPDYIGALVAA